MSDYGKDGSVENESYCMPGWQKRNVADMNQKMGYHNMSDLANTKRPPTPAPGEKANHQNGPKVANPSKNGRM